MRTGGISVRTNRFSDKSTTILYFSDISGQPFFMTLYFYSLLYKTFIITPYHHQSELTNPKTTVYRIGKKCVTKKPCTQFVKTQISRITCSFCFFFQAFDTLYHENQSSRTETSRTEVSFDTTTKPWICQITFKYFGKYKPKINK